MVRQVHGKETARLQWRVTDNPHYQLCEIALLLDGV
jgi:hypothetical protein